MLAKATKEKNLIKKLNKVCVGPVKLFIEPNKKNKNKNKLKRTERCAKLTHRLRE